MARIWLSGPRILGGLVRPGISFAASELYNTATPIKRSEYTRADAIKDIKAIVLKDTGEAIDDATANSIINHGLGKRQLSANDVIAFLIKCCFVALAGLFMVIISVIVYAIAKGGS